MNKEHTKHFYKNYPTVFSQVISRPKKAKVILPIYFGLEIGDGWFNVLDGLCRQLKWFENTYGILTIADQVKEKFGGLRFYHHGDLNKKIMTVHRHKDANGKDCWSYTWRVNSGVRMRKPEKNFDVRGIWNKIDGLVSMAEEMSYRTCERCGNPGKPNPGGWITTLCDKCRAADAKAAERAHKKYLRKEIRDKARWKKWEALPDDVKQRRIQSAKTWVAHKDVSKRLTTRAEAARYGRLTDFLWKTDRDYMVKRMDLRLAAFHKPVEEAQQATKEKLLEEAAKPLPVKATKADIRHKSEACMKALRAGVSGNELLEGRLDT